MLNALYPEWQRLVTASEKHPVPSVSMWQGQEFWGPSCCGLLAFNNTHHTAFIMQQLLQREDGGVTSWQTNIPHRSRCVPSSLTTFLQLSRGRHFYRSPQTQCENTYIHGGHILTLHVGEYTWTHTASGSDRTWTLCAHTQWLDFLWKLLWGFILVWPFIPRGWGKRQPVASA